MFLRFFSIEHAPPYLSSDSHHRESSPAKHPRVFSQPVREHPCEHQKEQEEVRVGAQTGSKQDQRSSAVVLLSRYKCLAPGAQQRLPAWCYRGRCIHTSGVRRASCIVLLLFFRHQKHTGSFSQIDLRTSACLSIPSQSSSFYPLLRKRRCRQSTSSAQQGETKGSGQRITSGVEDAAFAHLNGKCVGIVREDQLFEIGR